MRPNTARFLPDIGSGRYANMQQLIQLRWLAVLGQLVTIAFSQFIVLMHLPLWQMLTVIGGLVGAGALGYDVVYGFARSEAWGKGLAAGITIVLLGVMLDRITRAAADVRRDDGPGSRRAFHLRLPIGPPST